MWVTTCKHVGVNAVIIFVYNYASGASALDMLIRTLYVSNNTMETVMWLQFMGK